MDAPANLPHETMRTRHDGWTPDRRRNFLERVAEGHIVEAACAHVGMSKRTAYALRRRDPGFALAWSAALLRARDTVADTLTSRAIDGQVDVLTRADGTTVTRHRHDNRLGLALLARLDRLAAQPVTSEIGQPDEAAMRAATFAFDALVDLVEQGDLDADAVAAFIEPHIVKLRRLCRSDESEEADHVPQPPAPEESAAAAEPPQAGDLRDLHPAGGDVPEEPHPSHLASPSAPFPSPKGEGDVGGASTVPLPWEREGDAERREGQVLPSGPSRKNRASRDLRVEEPAHDPPGDPPLAEETGRPRIWYREGYSQYQTDLPPPPDFSFYQHGRYGEENYWRVLSPAELERHKRRERYAPTTPPSSRRTPGSRTEVDSNDAPHFRSSRNLDPDFRRDDDGG